MILLEFNNKKYTINKKYELAPKDDVLNLLLTQIIDTYNSPAQGFKTSYIAEKLEDNGINIMDVYDEELENSPDGVIY